MLFFRKTRSKGDLYAYTEKDFRVQTAVRKVMQPGESDQNIGIRLVYGIAKEVKYQNLLGMNVLTMRI